MFVQWRCVLAFTVRASAHPTSGNVKRDNKQRRLRGAAVARRYGYGARVFWTGRSSTARPCSATLRAIVLRSVSPQLPASRPSSSHSGFTRLDGQDSVVRPAYVREHQRDHTRSVPTNTAVFSVCFGDLSGAGTASMPLRSVMTPMADRGLTSLQHNPLRDTETPSNLVQSLSGLRECIIGYSTFRLPDRTVDRSIFLVPSRRSH